MKQIVFFLVLAVFFSCNSATSNKTQKQTEKTEVAETVINIGGMHCEMCVASITKGIGELEGIDSVKVSLTDSTAFVMFETEKVQLSDIEKAIEKRGFSIKK